MITEPGENTTIFTMFGTKFQPGKPIDWIIIKVNKVFCYILNFIIFVVVVFIVNVIFFVIVTIFVIFISIAISLFLLLAVIFVILLLL